MMRILISAACLALAACSSAPDALRSGDVTVVEGVTAIDARYGVRPMVDVVIDGDTILAVGADAGIGHRGAQRIDGEGKFLIPGLWDAHVHIAFDPAIDYRTFFPLSLAHGVTSLRDTGGLLEALAPARAEATRNPLTPDLYIAGPLIDGDPPVYDGQRPGFPNISVTAATPADGRRIVDDLAAAGVDVIKAYEMLSPATYRTIVRRAAYFGLPVLAHVPLSMTVAEAAATGPIDLQHLRNFEFDCTESPETLRAERQFMLQNPDKLHGSQLRTEIHRAQRPFAVAALDDAACDALVERMANAGVYQTPTLALTTFFVLRQFAEPAWTESFDLMPPAVAEDWRERVAPFRERPPTETGRAYIAWLRAMTGKLNAAGAPMIAGTDAPIAFLTPGLSLHEELEQLVIAGLSPMEAIEAATLTPAQFLGLDEVKGTIAPGMRADLVLLTADPLTDIRHTREIETVIKRGITLDSEQLADLKAQVAQ